VFYTGNVMSTEQGDSIRGHIKGGVENKTRLLNAGRGGITKQGRPVRGEKRKWA